MKKAWVQPFVACLDCSSNSISHPTALLPWVRCRRLTLLSVIRLRKEITVGWLWHYWQYDTNSSPGVCNSVTLWRKYRTISPNWRVQTLHTTTFGSMFRILNFTANLPIHLNSPASALDKVIYNAEWGLSTSCQTQFSEGFRKTWLTNCGLNSSWFQVVISILKPIWRLCCLGAILSSKTPASFWTTAWPDLWWCGQLLITPKSIGSKIKVSEAPHC